jgi:hypothetical protein
MKKQKSAIAAIQSASLVMAAALISSLSAAPKIEFDTKTFKCGEFLEGKADKLNAVFTVKNTGNADLKLTNVRPGCGCTVVKFDSLIKPGKSAKIEAAVNIANYRPGAISKFINVTSNAENEPSAKLSIEAMVVAVIDVSAANLSLGGDDTAKSKTIVLASKMKDLKVTEMFFRTPENSSKNVPEWQKEIPLVFKYTWAPADSVRPDGFHVYKLSFLVPRFEQPENGEMVIKTNHPDKPEIVLGTALLRTTMK